jgi:CheY-like chemotaxis protein
MSQPTVLVVGSSDLAAGVDCVVAVDSLSSGAIVRRVDGMSAAVEYLSDGSSLCDSPRCDLIVLCESRRGQFSTEAIDGLRRLSPLARIWRLVGSWHEGEPRTGHPPAGCLSTYWHQWPARAERALEATAGWNLPPTATPEERLLAQNDKPIEQHEGTIVVCAGRLESALALADVCRLAGYDIVIVRDGDDLGAAAALAVVWDATPERLHDEVAVARLKRLTREAPIVAVVGFPRADDVRRARQAGVSAVVSKPYLVRDLLWQLEQAISSDSPHTTAWDSPHTTA